MPSERRSAGRRPSPWIAGAAPTLLALASLPSQERIDAWIDDLDDVDRQPRACSLLEAAGARAVGALTQVLRDLQVPRTGASERAQMALYVLGRLQARAVSALPEVRAIYASNWDVAVRAQALWAMGQLTIWSDAEEEFVATRRCLEKHQTSDLPGLLFASLRTRLDLGPAPDPVDLRRRLLSGDAADIVAVAATAGQVAWDEEFTATLHERLVIAFADDREAWDSDRRLWSTVDAIAAGLWDAGMRDAVCALGLLRHWDPCRQRQGLLFLADVEPASARAREAIVACLFARDREVRELALAVIRTWQDEALAALHALQICSRGRDDAWARVCAAAADHIVAAWVRRGATTDGAKQVVSVIRETGRERSPPNPAASRMAWQDPALRLALKGLRSEDPAGLLRVARFVRESGCEDRETMMTFVRLLGVTDRDRWHTAVRTLVELGPRLASTVPDFPVLVMRSAPMAEANTWYAIVADSWVRAGPSATDADLERACGGERWHVALRGFCEALGRLERGDAISEAVLQSARGVSRRLWPSVELSQGADWGELHGNGWGKIELPPNTNALQAVASLVLLAHGEGAPQDVSERLARLLDESGPMVLDRVTELSAKKEWSALARIVEDRLRLGWQH